MFFFDYFEHILSHAVEVLYGIPAPLFAGGGVVYFNFAINFRVNNMRIWISLWKEFIKND
jgi:hypothetical protein